MEFLECAALKFEEVDDSSSEEFKDAMEIYIDSFPKSERRLVESIAVMLNDGKIRLVVGLLDSEVAFMALLYPIAGTPFVLGDYMATAEKYRGRGIGKQFFENIHGAFDYFLIQVENPHISSDAKMARRVEFYRRLGLKELEGLRYVLPPLQGTMPTEMILMILPKRDEDSLEGNLIRAVIIRIFRELDNRQDDDEFLVTTLQGVPDQIRLT